MTANQIRKALVKAGINMSTILEIGRDLIEVGVLDAETGRCDHDLTNAAMEKVDAVFPWGGSGTGYGSVRLRRDYRAPNPELTGIYDPMHY